MAVNTITRILCPVDFSEYSRRALDHAAALALWYKAPLTVLHVFATLPVDLAPAVPHLPGRGQYETELHNFTEGLPREIALDHVIREARDARTEILTQVDILKADLLVMGSHGRSGVKRLVLGSVTEAMMQTAPCPLLVVPHGAPDVMPGAPTRFSRILCPTDFSQASIQALRFALDLTERAQAHLTLLHAIEVPPEFGENRMAPDFDVNRVRADAEARALERLRTAMASAGMTSEQPDTVVVEGHAHREILRQASARKIGLIVMGAHGHSAVDLLLFGSNTQQVVRAATCPVLVVGGSRRSVSERIEGSESPRVTHAQRG